MAERQSSARPTSVYRYYDKNNLLLYVGITSRGITRNHEHNTTKEWWQFVTRQEVEHYPTRPQAAARERALIRKYRPPFNVQHNPDHATTRGAYLALATDGNGKVRNVMPALVRSNGKNRIELGVERIGNTLILRSHPDDSGTVRWLDTEPRADIHIAFSGAKGARAKLDHISVKDGCLLVNLHCQRYAARCTGASIMLRMPNGKRRQPSIKRIDLRGAGGAA